MTNVPPSSDLSNPPGSLGGGSLASSSTTPAAVLHYLLSTPTPTILNSRKVILEYVLNRETRLREKKHGLGGKGTLGRDSFEEIAARLGEIEDGLRGTGSLVGPNAAAVPAVPDEELDTPRKTGLALILSLRMLLSYFTLPDLARQLLCQHPSDAERTLVQHIRRRVGGEGRYNVGRELEFVESLVRTACDLMSRDSPASAPPLLTLPRLLTADQRCAQHSVQHERVPTSQIVRSTRSRFPRLPSRPASSFSPLSSAMWRRLAQPQRSRTCRRHR